MSLTALSVSSLLDAFASSDPTPGGGSAAALAGAMGASLLTMVAAMPKTKTGSPEAREALDAAGRRLASLRTALIDLIDRDSAAYDLVVSAYRRPKATDAEKAERKNAIQQAMRVATEVPLETATTCAAVLAEAAIVGEHGNPNAASDVGTAVALLKAGIRGAELNVEINVGSLTDASLAAQVRTRLAAATQAAR